MSHTLHLPNAMGQIENYTLVGQSPVKPQAGVKFNRIAYSAAHVVANPLAAHDPWLDCAVDWDATIAYRKHLWSLGMGVAEAMDTAQRGMGLDWPTSLELIGRSIEASKDVPGAFLASVLIGVIQTFAVAIDYSFLALAKDMGWAVSAAMQENTFAKLTVSQVAPILPYLFLVLILIFRPKGLLGTREG